MQITMGYDLRLSREKASKFCTKFLSHFFITCQSFLYSRGLELAVICFLYNIIKSILCCSSHTF